MAILLDRRLNGGWLIQSKTQTAYYFNSCSEFARHKCPKSLYQCGAWFIIMLIDWIVFKWAIISKGCRVSVLPYGSPSLWKLSGLWGRADYLFVMNILWVFNCTALYQKALDTTKRVVEEMIGNSGLYSGMRACWTSPWDSSNETVHCTRNRKHASIYTCSADERRTSFEARCLNIFETNIRWKEKWNNREREYSQIRSKENISGSQSKGSSILKYLCISCEAISR